VTYEEALQYIASLQARGWRLGLDRMEEFVRRAGLEDAIGTGGSPGFIHVAGTNGKGSTTAYLQSMLVENGYRTGAFFSPYVVDPRERVQFGRDLIGKEDFANLTEWLRPIGESLDDTEFGGVTEFEFKTGLAFTYWRMKRCEWVALEVGLGGRLDATNVVNPRATIITSISLDHTNILGNSIEEIAVEKAGIVKAGVPLMVGEMPDGALRPILEIADQRHAPVWRFGKEVRWDSDTVITPRREHRGIKPGIRGAKQEVNVSLAIAAMDAAGATNEEDAMRAGAARAFIPGRFQELEFQGRRILLDGAHNAEAAQVLRKSLEDLYPGRRLLLVTNMLQGHGVPEFYGPIRELVDHAFVCPIDFHRTRPADETARELNALGISATAVDSVGEAMSRSMNIAKDHHLILVTGSFYLVGEVLHYVPGY
jgi:dihydrofolate synthase/folylpolyglutamate synthase